MVNPFKYGTVVTGDDFVDREKELEELKHELLSKKSVILYSQRRLGKTSLLMELFQRFGKDVATVYIDMYGIQSRDVLAREIISGVIESTYTKLDKIRDVVREFLVTIRPRIVLTHEGNIGIEIVSGKELTAENMREAFDFGEKIAYKRKKLIVMVFDEFQEIGSLDGVEIEKLMRSRFQHHKNVVYVFAGSKPHLLQQIFNEESRAFYKFARPMTIGMISKEEFSKFIVRKFRENNGNINQHVVDRILEVTKGHPYYTQKLCHELWYISNRIDEPVYVENAIERIVAHQKNAYERIWDEIKSKTQRNLLVGIAKEKAPSIYSAEFIERYKLKTQSHVQRAMALLENRSMLENGEIIDIFLKEWLKKRF